MKRRILNFGISRFPNATESSQVLKVGEEIDEHYDEVPYSEAWYEELSDVYIAAVHGYERFQNKFCRFIVEQIEERSDFVIVAEYVEKKMIENEQREWSGDKHVKKKTIKRINYKTGDIIEETINA